MKPSEHESLTGRVDQAFPEYLNVPADPITLLQRWVTTAERAGVREPKALALASSDARGRLSSRVVVIHDLDGRGLTFLTHSTSRKATDFDQNPWACGLLYWRETGQQISIGGPVERMAQSEVEACWSARPTGTHAMSTVSAQSQPLEDVERLRRRAEAYDPDAPLPMPHRFIGFRLVPTELEFWAASSDRLHRRLTFSRHPAGWRWARLQP